MTISFRGATGLTANTVVAVTWTLPGNLAANDLILACYAGKPFNATFGATNPPQGYTALGSAVNSNVANGVGVGSNHGVAYWKVHNGAEGATMTGTLGVAPSPSMAAVAGFRSDRGGTAWSVQTTVGSDVVVTGTTFSALGSASLVFYPGQMLVVAAATPDDSGTPSAWAVTASGITFGTAAQVLGTAITATGNDGALQVIRFPVTAGIGTVTPTFTMTAASGDSNGVAVFMLLTEPQGATGVVTGTSNTSGTDVGKKATTGVVTGSSNTSGTDVGSKQAFRTVTGTSNTSGTIVGTKFIPSNDKTGAVTGSSNTSGTIAGKKATTGVVTGSSTTSGTIVGAEGDFATVTGTSNTSGTIVGKKGAARAVTGQSSTSGTVAGTKGGKGAVAASSNTSGTVVGTKYEAAKFGTVTGTSNTSGTIVGTKYDPTAPTTVTGGMSAYRRQQIAAANLAYQEEAARVANARGGSVHGSTSTTGHIRGHAARSGRTLPTPGITYRSHITGTKSVGSRMSGATETRGCAYGDAVYPMSTRVLRQVRDDAELLLLI